MNSAGDGRPFAIASPCNLAGHSLLVVVSSFFYDYFHLFHASISRFKHTCAHIQSGMNKEERTNMFSLLLVWICVENWRTHDRLYSSCFFFFLAFIICIGKSAPRTSIASLFYVLLQFRAKCLGKLFSLAFSSNFHIEFITHSLTHAFFLS